MIFMSASNFGIDNNYVVDLLGFAESRKAPALYSVVNTRVKH